MPTVDYDRFVRLQGLGLCHYMEPLIRDIETSISQGVLVRMLGDLPKYDEYHLVYALTLGAAHLPEAFLPHVPRYLASEDGSVFCTAFNILDRLADKYITQDLIDSVRAVAVSHRVRDSVAAIVAKLERRRYLG